MRKILIAYDGGPTSLRALFTAAQLARATHALVGVISVVPAYHGRGGPVVEPWDDAAVHREQLEQAELILSRSDIAPELIQLTGDPATIIESVAERDEYDTVVLGGSRKGALERLLRGDVAAHVARHSRATVVLAR